MKPIRTVVFLLLTLFTVQHLWADDFDLYLVGVEDASYTSLDFSRLRSLSFTQTRENVDGSNIYVNRLIANYTDGSAHAYNLADYGSLRFAAVDAVGIEGLAAEPSAPKPFQLDGTVLVPRFAGTLVVCQLDGRVVYTSTVATGERTQLPALAPGVYIVNLGGFSTKILVK